jgi:hypothetical protein
MLLEALVQHSKHYIYVFDPLLFIAIVGAAANVVIAVFSIVIWRVYRNQLATMKTAVEETRQSNRAIDESNRIADRNLELGRRSWLVVTISTGFPSIPDTNSPGRSISSDVAVQNVGGVPAIIQRFGCDFVLDNLPERLSLSADRSQPDATAVYGDAPERLWRTWSVPGAIHAGQRDVYFYWIVEYSDCFGKTWRTTRCWRRVEARQTWDKVPGYTLLE